MIKIKREKFSDCINDIMPMCVDVHKIMGLEIYGLELNFDEQLYQQAEDAEQFHCLVMRKNNIAIGFHWLLICPLARFKGYSQAVTDAIFVKPEHRNQSQKLIAFSEQYAKDRGAHIWGLATLDPVYRGKLWERKGFKKTETIFMKKLGV